MIYIKKIVILMTILTIFCFGLMSVVNANSVTINPSNDTLNNVINKYDTIYLDNGVYKGASNKNITVSRNTTIIGLNKGGVIFDDEYKSSSFNIKSKVSLTLINLTFTKRVSPIFNQGRLTITNVVFKNNDPIKGVIHNSGVLRISDSSFNNNYNVLINSFGNDIIRNCEFNNNKGNIDGLLVFRGLSRNISLINLTFFNNSVPTGMIVIRNSYINLNISNSSFINSKGNMFAIIGEFSLIVGSKIKISNINEINTIVNYNPYIDVKIYLKKNNLMIFKATLRDVHGMTLPKQRLYFYINGKLVGSNITNNYGVTTFNYKKIP